eukprot:g23374.t1
MSEEADRAAAAERATALHIAAFNGHLHTAELLVAAGASLDVKDKKGMTPLDLARQFKEQEVVKLLESAAQKKVEAATGGYAAEAKPSAALIGAKAGEYVFVPCTKKGANLKKVFPPNRC